MLWCYVDFDVVMFWYCVALASCWLNYFPVLNFSSVLYFMSVHSKVILDPPKLLCFVTSKLTFVVVP